MGRSPRNAAASANGTELTGNAILTWADPSRVAWHYIAPGKPMQNAFIESFVRAGIWRSIGIRRQTGAQLGDDNDRAGC